MEDKMSTEIEVKLEPRLLDAKVFSDLAKKLNETVEASLKTSSDLTGLYDLTQQNLTLQGNIKSSQDQIANLVKERDATKTAHEIFLPDAALSVFNLTRQDIADPDSKPLYPALRAWCGFVEWSEKGEKAGFEKAFRKVDNELCLLRGDVRLDSIRRRIENNVWDVIDRNIRATYKVSWSGVDQPYDANKHNVKAPSGTIITFVENALITLDDAVIEKAIVETGTVSRSRSYRD